MGKYAKYQRKPVERRRMSPIWRGIGCILIVIVPLMAFGLMAVFTPSIIATGKVPYLLMGNVHFPLWVSRNKILADVTGFISGINNLWLDVITFFIILLLLTTVTSLVYSFIYGMVGPSRYTAQDAPPPKYKPKAYKR